MSIPDSKAEHELNHGIEPDHEIESHHEDEPSEDEKDMVCTNVDPHLM